MNTYIYILIINYIYIYIQNFVADYCANHQTTAVPSQLPTGHTTTTYKDSHHPTRTTTSRQRYRQEQTNHKHTIHLSPPFSAKAQQTSP